MKSRPKPNYTPLIEYIQQHLVSVKQNQIEEEEPEIELEPIACSSFPELIRKMKRAYEFNLNLEMSLAAILAVKHSVAFKELPLWMFIVGPPSSGKTTLVECVSTDKENTYNASKFKGIHSGWKNDSKDTTDHGLLPKINNKCLIIKDFTTLLNGSRESLDEIMGELRDVYDGSTTVDYRNDIYRSYDNINFSILACTTYEILGHVQNMAAMGERFLMMNITDGHADDTGIVKRAIGNLMESIFDEEEEKADKHEIRSKSALIAQRAVLGYMQVLSERYNDKPKITISEEQEEQIECLAKFISFMRTKVSRTKQRQLEYRPVREFAGRLGVQLMKMAISLCYVLDKEHVDDDVMTIIYKIAGDTCQGFSQEIVMALYYSDSKMTVKEIAEVAHTSKATARQKLLDLIELKVVSAVQSKPKVGPGRAADYYGLSPDFQIIMDTIYAEPPTINKSFASPTKKKTRKKPSRSNSRKKGGKTKKTNNRTSK